MKKNLTLPCLRGVLGDWVYYSSMMTAQQISDWIMPVKEIREAKSLDDVLQRELKARKKKIAEYLLTDERHFFNSIILGVFEGVPEWAEFDFNEKIQEKINSKEKEYLENSMGLMTFNGNEKIFAIDGQHRVEGIKIALEQDKEKQADEQILKDDQFSVIFIAHIDDYEGKKRTRKLFSDINKNAKKVSKGDNIVIDEEEIEAIVARKVYTNYKYFDNGELIALTENAKLDKDDTEHFTNLIALHKVNKELQDLFKPNKDLKVWETENVDKFKEIVFNFYDYIFDKVEEYKSFFIDKNLTLQEVREKNKYLLFRPVGLTIIAKLYVHFIKKEEKDIFEKNINKISFIMPDSMLNKVLWTEGRMEAKTGNQTLAFNLILYVLNDYPQDKEAELLDNYRKTIKNDDAELPEKIELE